MEEKRVIKFRAWDEKSKEMLYGNNGLYMFVGTGKLGWNCGYEYTDVDNGFEIMQYTGLKDENGKEIYEGDIVKIETYGSIEIGEVVYQDGFFVIKLLPPYDWDPMEKWVCMDNENLVQVIGNKFENPELLE